MNHELCDGEIDAMDIFDKAKVYNHYMCAQIGLRTRPHFWITWMVTDWAFLGFDRGQENPGGYLFWKDIRPGGVIKNYAERAVPTVTDFLWQQTYPMQSFDEFVREGIYEWYWKFKNKGADCPMGYWIR